LVQKLHILKKLLSFLLLAFVASSCGFFTDNTAGGKKKAAIHTLVFFDKTASVNTANAFVQNKYAAALKSLISENINQEGDVLEVYFIHENTAKSRSLVMKSRTEYPDPAGLNATDLEAAKSTYDIDIDRERKRIFQNVLQKMLEKNESASNIETNISGSVPVLAKALEGGDDLKVYYFSDMVESIKTGRDFHKTSPISVDQATEWAKADAQEYKLYNLSGAEIKWILPFEPNSTSKINNPNVGDYWKAFFEKLGAGLVEEI
jgi:hypothetical protein